MVHGSYCIPLLIQSNVIYQTFVGTSTRELELVRNYSMQTEKYSNTATYIFTLKARYRLENELKQAGHWVTTVPNQPQAPAVTLRTQEMKQNEPSL